MSITLKDLDASRHGFCDINHSQFKIGGAKLKFGNSLKGDAIFAFRGDYYFHDAVLSCSRNWHILRLFHFSQTASICSFSQRFAVYHLFNIIVFEVHEIIE